MPSGSGKGPVGFTLSRGHQEGVSTQNAPPRCAGQSLESLDARNGHFMSLVP